MDVLARDVDGDHDVDLLVTNGKSKSLGILRNRLAQGVFEFEPAESFGTADFPGATRISLAVADLDGNGLEDIASANNVANRLLVNLNELVAWIPSSGVDRHRRGFNLEFRVSTCGCLRRP